MKPAPEQLKTVEKWSKSHCNARRHPNCASVLLVLKAIKQTREQKMTDNNISIRLDHVLHDTLKNVFLPRFAILQKP